MAVAAADPVILTGLVEPKLRVGKSCAPFGLDVTEAVRATGPVKPPVGVTVTIAVFPVVAPGLLIVTALPLTVKLGATVPTPDRAIV